MRSAMVLCAALILCASTPAAAEEQASAEGLFALGGELFEANRFADALAAYERSYAMSPVNIVLYNIALCERALGRPAEAAQTFERYLERGGERIPAERQQEVRAWVEELRAAAGAAASSAPTEPAASPGDAQAPGSPEPAPEPAPPPAPVEEPTPVVEPAPRQPEPGPPLVDHRGRTLRLAGYVTGGVAVAVLGTTLGLYVWNAGRSDSWEQASRDLSAQWLADAEHWQGDEQLDAAYDDNRALGEELQTWGAVEWALLGVGVAALGAAVALLVVGLRARRHRSVASSMTGAPLELRLASAGGLP
jgi:tetratricopeptide (TPR) repeat protein